MSDLSDFLKETSDTEQAERRPKGAESWKPGLQLGKDGGTVTTVGEASDIVDPYAADVDWATIFASWRLNPEHWEVIDDSITVNAWESGENTMVQYKARIRRRQPVQEAHYQDLMDRAARRKLLKSAPKATEGGVSLLVPIGDTQIGKPDGDGTYGSILRWQAVIEELPARIKQLRGAGHQIDSAVVAFLGDLKEGCDGHYAQQTFGVELNNRDQDRLIVELGLETIETIAKHIHDITVVAVPGNHGERRKDGRSFTNEADNDDVTLIEQIRRITQRDANLERIQYRFPNSQDLSVSIDISGVRTAFVHGHQFRGGGGGLSNKIEKWWAGQAHGNQLVGEADLLVAGHHHHLHVADTGSKTFISIPALDGGSNWWRHSTGADNPPGALTMVVGENLGPRGFDELKILGQGQLFERESTQ